jgi:hypothetical protein
VQKWRFEHKILGALQRQRLIFDNDTLIFMH